MNVAAIVLAAGKSERMGRNKLLLRLNDQTTIDHVLNAIAATHVHETIIVLGHRPEELASLLSSRKKAVRTIINSDYRHGMITSLQKGLRGLRCVDAAFLILGDQPILDAGLIDKMILRLEDDPNAFIISPICNGKKGHPVLFRSALFDEILSLDERATIRDVVHNYAHKLLTIEAPKWTTMDIDTPEDYQHICSLMRDDSRF